MLLGAVKVVLNKEISIKKIDNETSNIKIYNNNILSLIVGEFNKNLIGSNKISINYNSIPMI